MGLNDIVCSLFVDWVFIRGKDVCFLHFNYWVFILVLLHSLNVFRLISDLIILIFGWLNRNFLVALFTNMMGRRSNFDKIHFIIQILKIKCLKFSIFNRSHRLRRDHFCWNILCLIKFYINIIQLFFLITLPLWWTLKLSIYIFTFEFHIHDQISLWYPDIFLTLYYCHDLVLLGFNLIDLIFKLVLNVSYVIPELIGWLRTFLRKHFEIFSYRVAIWHSMWRNWQH